MKPIGILFVVADITAIWFLGLSWRIYGPRFVRGMTSDERLTEGDPS